MADVEPALVMFQGTVKKASPKEVKEGHVALYLASRDEPWRLRVINVLQSSSSNMNETAAEQEVLRKDRILFSFIYYSFAN